MKSHKSPKNALAETLIGSRSGFALFLVMMAERSLIAIALGFLKKLSKIVFAALEHALQVLNLDRRDIEYVLARGKTRAASKQKKLKPE